MEAEPEAEAEVEATKAVAAITVNSATEASEEAEKTLAKVTVKANNLEPTLRSITEEIANSMWKICSPTKLKSTLN